MLNNDKAEEHITYVGTYIKENMTWSQRKCK